MVLQAPAVMKTEVLVCSLLAVVLGTLSAVVTSSMLAQGPAPGREAAVPATPAAWSDSEHSDRLRELEIENQELRERLAIVELRLASTSRVPIVEGVSKEELEAFEQDVWDRFAAEQNARAGTLDLEVRVADALQSIRKQEQLEAIRRFQEKQARGLEDRLARLTRDLGLDDHQVNELRSIFTTQMERNRELTRLWQESADSQSLGEAKRLYAEEDRAAIERTLTPEQLATYRSTWRSGAKSQQDL